MAGNVREWTMEYHSENSRVRRGGRYGVLGIDDPISCRYSDGPNNINAVFGFRIVLFIN